MSTPATSASTIFSAIWSSTSGRPLASKLKESDTDTVSSVVGVNEGIGLGCLLGAPLGAGVGGTDGCVGTRVGIDVGAYTLTRSALARYAKGVVATAAMERLLPWLPYLSHEPVPWAQSTKSPLPSIQSCVAAPIFGDTTYPSPESCAHAAFALQTKFLCNDIAVKSASETVVTLQ